jgi:hypothetical protein
MQKPKAKAAAAVAEREDELVREVDQLAHGHAEADEVFGVHGCSSFENGGSSRADTLRVRSGVCSFVVLSKGSESPRLPRSRPHTLVGMANLESRLWTILPIDFRKKPARGSGPEILNWRRSKHENAIEGIQG